VKIIDHRNEKYNLLDLFAEPQKSEHAPIRIDIFHIGVGRCHHCCYIHSSHFKHTS